MRIVDALAKPVRIKPRKIMAATPCAAETNQLFNCWRSSAVGSVGCAESAMLLVACMKAKGKMAKSKSNPSGDVNYWLKKDHSNGKHL